MDTVLKALVKKNGLFDVQASLEAVAIALNAANEVYANDAEKVGAAVNATFDQYKGAFIQMQALQSIAVGKLGCTSLEAINAMQLRVAQYVEANPETFEIRKGRGVGRVGECPAKGSKETPATA
jgi:hypothetical protein